MKLSENKAIIIGVIISILALLPLIEEFIPHNVKYNKTTEVIQLKTGLNQFNNLELIIGKGNKIVQAKKVNHQIIDEFLGFKDFKTFLLMGSPYFSIMGLCIFVFWYNNQQKSRILIKLKNYALAIFLFVSTWFISWTLIPVYNFPKWLYDLGITILTAISLVSVCYLNRYYHTKLKYKRNIISSLLSYVFEVRNKHYSRMAIKALGNKNEDYQETCDQIEEYDKRTSQEIVKVEVFINSDKLKERIRRSKKQAFLDSLLKRAGKRKYVLYHYLNLTKEFSITQKN